MNFKSFARASACAIAVSVASAANAEESAPDTIIVVTAPYIVPAETSSASKTDQPILLTPQSVQVIPRQVLLDQNAITLTDAVRNVAGVFSSCAASRPHR
jgi:iron complex outermembrane recepter protein